MKRTRAIAIATLAVSAYTSGVVLSLHLEPLVRLPLLDGSSQAPYRYVCPPQGATATPPPNSAAGTFHVSSTGSGVIPILSTTDGQIQLVVQKAAFPSHGSDTSVRIAMTPECADKVNPPPSGYQIAGNAYVISATYQPSGAAATLQKPAGMLIRYAGQATSALVAPPTHVLFVESGSGWTRLGGQDNPSGLQVSESSLGTLGVFAVMAPTTKGKSLVPAILGVLAAAVALALVIAFASGTIGPLRKPPSENEP